MAKQNIEVILDRVRAVESRDPAAGLTIRRAVEQAENDWNAHPDNDNVGIVVKKMDGDDILASAEKIGLAGNANVRAFAKAIDSLPEPKPSMTPEQIAAREKTAADKEAADQKKAESLIAESMK